MVCEFEASGRLCHLKGLREGCHISQDFYERCEVRRAGLLFAEVCSSLFRAIKLNAVKSILKECESPDGRFYDEGQKFLISEFLDELRKILKEP